MSEYLQQLAQKLELNYLGVVGSDGIIIYQTPYEKEGLPEEVAGELSEIVSDLRRLLLRNIPGAVPKTLYLDTENGHRVGLMALQPDIFLMAFLSPGSYWGKVSFYLGKSKQEILSHIL